MSLEATARRVLALPPSIKRVIAIGADSILCVLSVWIAFYLRTDNWIAFRGLQWLAVGGSILLAIPTFIISGLYRAISRYFGAFAIASIAQAAIVYGVMYATIFTFIQIETVPRTVGIMQPVLLFLFVGASRVVASWLLGRSYVQILNGADRQNVLIYGAGSAGRQLFMALSSTEMRVVGFIDDDPRLHDRLLFRRPVYPPALLETMVTRHDVTDVLLALPSASRKRRHEIHEFLSGLPVAVRTVPGLVDVAQGRVLTNELRELEINDLLGRAPVAPDKLLLEKNIRDKVVLVTGAGGSIGSELCRQILSEKPKKLLLVEVSEPSLYSIHRELESADTETEIVPLLASVCDAERIRSIIAAWAPDTIYHAAAYKHVPLVEHNPLAGLRNNVFGTLKMALAAREGGVSDFVSVSTDKAVRPTNVMGASKRLAEIVLQAMAADALGHTCFSMVRFGNVLGSSGSVVPLFWKQIQMGGPVTITHRDITRYFMTIPEAAQLVVQAGAMASGAEVFVLDMGEPVKIIDLARKMIELSGLQVRDNDSPDGDIAIQVVGLRPAEKLYEELLIGNNPAATGHPRILKANEEFIPWPVLHERLDRVDAAIQAGDVIQTMEILRELVPEYQSDTDLLDWVYLQKTGDRGQAE